MATTHRIRASASVFLSVLLVIAAIPARAGEPTPESLGPDAACSASSLPDETQSASIDTPSVAIEAPEPDASREPGLREMLAGSAIQDWSGGIAPSQGALTLAPGASRGHRKAWIIVAIVLGAAVVVAIASDSGGDGNGGGGGY